MDTRYVVSLIIQLIVGLGGSCLFAYRFCRMHNEQKQGKLIQSLLFLAGIVISLAVLFNALYFLILNNVKIPIASLFGNQEAFPVLLSVANLAIMLCIAYFQYLIQRQANNRVAEDVLAQSVLDISQFECICRLYNYHLDNCRSFYLEKFNNSPWPILEFEFSESCLKNYISIEKVDAKLYNDHEDEKMYSCSLKSDTTICIVLRSEKNNEKTSEFVNSILLAPYQPPFAEHIIKVEFDIEFNDQRYIKTKDTKTHHLKLTFALVMDKYDEFGKSNVNIISRRIELSQ